MFNLGFSPEQQAVSSNASSKGSRRRRKYAKSRKAQVEPFQQSKKHDSPMTKSDIYFALDCEMVGVGPDGVDSALARVTLVNWENKVILDTFVKVPVPVTDYRTHVSGITAADIESNSAMTFDQVRNLVQHILRGKILIGHGLENDLRALQLTHPWCDVRDTACYYMREGVDAITGKPVLQRCKLRDVAWNVLGRQIQCEGKPHCPTEDAVASLDLYKAARNDWENQLTSLQRAQAEKQERRMSFLFGGSSDANNNMTMAYEQGLAMLPHPMQQQHFAGQYGAAPPGYAPPHMPYTPPAPPMPPPPPSNNSSWFRFEPFFRRPKTPPLQDLKHSETQATEITVDTQEEDHEDDHEDDPQQESEDSDPTPEDHEVLPDIECLTLESAPTTEGPVRGLPFYSMSSIW